MARQTDGISHSLQSASNLSLGAPSKLAVSYWLWWDSFSNNNAIAIESTANYNSNPGAFIVNPNDSATSAYQSALKGAAAEYNDGNFARPSAASWHHYLHNYDTGLATNEYIDAYLDGSLQTLSRVLNDNTTVTFIDSLLNLMSRNNASLFGAGRIAEVAIWGGVNLTGTDATDLFNGTKLPTDIQAGSLKHYWKLCGVASPEPATVGSVAMTVNGATFVAHPSAVAGSCGIPITGLRPAICL
jgi:hypothetical protein